MLSPKQKSYAQARAEGMNQTNSALAAGYSEKTARQAASRLEKDPDVFAHIQRLKGAPLEQVALSTQKTVKRLEKFVSKPIHADDAPKTMDNIGTLDPLEFMKQLVSDVSEDPRLRLEAAKALSPYIHAKKAEMGKKESQQAAADELKTSSRFGLRSV